MSDFWTVTENPAGYGKLERPLEYVVENELEVSGPVRILDVGSSNGAGFSRLVDYLEDETGREFESVNLDPQSVIYSDRAQGNSDHHVRGMAGRPETSLPVKDNSVDLVVSNYLLPFIGRKKSEEFPGETQSQALNQIHSILRPGGAVGIHVDPYPANEDSVSDHWVLSYEDFSDLGEETEAFTQYPLVPEEGRNMFYGDNRDSLPDGFYDDFRDRLGF
ncbi:class I SAM-dependent methyltransferase [Candidatus Nanosalina sp. VS9-1]|uniref:class I SAM-dependent methyltransferase n=1 Tax=Candidatus Nanosalina sp. VS9-1 TaxID=3388566 RepID=UPI0039E0AD08